MAWEPPPIETDPDAVTGRILDAIAEAITGWEPHEGAVDVALAEEIGRETAATNARAVEVIELAVAGFGETAFGITARQGERATMTAQLTVTEVGAVVPAGLVVVGVNPAGVEVAFETLEAVVAADPEVAVQVQAVDVGAAYNGVAAGPLVVATATATVISAETAAGSSGGLDAETLTDYLTRLVDYLSVLRPGGVRAADLVVLARTVAGVHRAVAADLYDPAAPGTPAERTVTVFPVDVAGAPVTVQVAADLTAVLEAAREVNFVVHVEDPTYTQITVVFDVVATIGADTSLVHDNVVAALTEHLDPATWGTTPGDPRAWVETTTVRYLELVTIAGSVPGVDFVDSLTLNAGTVDVVMDGPAALPAPLTGGSPSSITGTVS